MEPVESALKALLIRNSLIESADFIENRINDVLKPIEPFKIGNDIILVIIGQDPTIKNVQSRQHIIRTLNLDKNGALTLYIEKIIKGLNIGLENIYATNIFKYFYTIPPAQTMHVLKAHLESNLELLKEELAAYPDAKIITLGEPVLQLLTHENNRVREYWDYDLHTKQSNGNFKFCDASENKLNRIFHPFPHQPSIRKAFYNNYIEEYIKFVKAQN